MTVTPGVSSPVSAAVSSKRFAVSPGVSPSRGNSYQDSSGSSLGEKEEIGQIDPQSSILNPQSRARERYVRFIERVSGLDERVSVTSVSSASRARNTRRRRSPTMTTLQPTTFDPEQREREKQASREADERALAAGESAEAIDARNAFLTADRTIVHWDRSRPL
jgi:hypothetical protein